MDFCLSLLLTLLLDFLHTPNPAPPLHQRFYWSLTVKTLITVKIHSWSSGEAWTQSIEDKLKAIVSSSCSTLRESI